MTALFRRKLILNWLFLVIGTGVMLSGCQRQSDSYRTLTEDDIQSTVNDVSDHSLSTAKDPTKTSETIDQADVVPVVVADSELNEVEASKADEKVADLKAVSDSHLDTPSPNSLAVESLTSEITDQNSTDSLEMSPETQAGNDVVDSAQISGDMQANDLARSEMNPGSESISAETSLGPRTIKLLVPHNELTREGPEQLVRISFDDLDLLKILNMEPVPPDAADHFPEWLRALNGQRVVLRGWMFPPTRQEGISSFMFVRDNGICCFGRDPKVYDKLGVQLRKNLTTPYIQNRPFDVVGKLVIEPEIEGDDEGMWWLYFLEDAVVIDK